MASDWHRQKRLESQLALRIPRAHRTAGDSPFAHGPASGEARRQALYDRQALEDAFHVRVGDVAEKRWGIPRALPTPARPEPWGRSPFADGPASGEPRKPAFWAIKP